MCNSILDVLKFIIKRIIWKGIKDVALTVYDDFAFKCMSFVRLAFAVALMVTVYSWYWQQFHNLRFEFFPQLVQLDIALAGLYGVKKWVRRNSNNGENSN